MRNTYTTGLEEGYEVVCFLANVGQEEDWDLVRQKAAKIGALKMVIEDLQKEFGTAHNLIILHEQKY
jgi:argininosuccinate synthase